MPRGGAAPLSASGSCARRKGGHRAMGRCHTTFIVQLPCEEEEEVAAPQGGVAPPSSSSSHARRKGGPPRRRDLGRRGGR
jgi:hypothetical protein